MDYFKRGIEAARIAERNRAEISEVFDTLNKQLADETSGSIEINIRQLRVPLGPPILGFLSSRETYDAIAAHNPKVKSASIKELARWSQEHTGYPCKIGLNNKEIYCEDKEALELGLTEVLEDPVVGQILYELIQLQPEGEEGDGISISKDEG